MEYSKLIRQRRSVRTFDGRDLDAGVLEDVLAFAKEAQNPYGIPIEWRLLSSKRDGVTSPVIVGTDAFIAGKLKRAPRGEEAFGYAFERVVLYAQSLGLGTTWIGGTMNRSVFEERMELGDGEVLPCVSPLGYPAEKMSVREVMMRKGVKADSRMKFGELFFDGSFERPLAPEDAVELLDALELVRLAPSAVNKQPWRIVVNDGRLHLYEKHSKGYVDKSGWDMQRIDLGIAMYHLVCGLEERGLFPALELEDPGLPHGEELEYIATYKL